jgi:hypothetical protein
VGSRDELFFIKNVPGVLVLIPVIPVTQEAEMRRIRRPV